MAALIDGQVSSCCGFSGIVDCGGNDPSQYLREERSGDNMTETEGSTCLKGYVQRISKHKTFGLSSFIV